MKEQYLAQKLSILLLMEPVAVVVAGFGKACSVVILKSTGKIQILKCRLETKLSVTCVVHTVNWFRYSCLHMNACTYVYVVAVTV